MPYDGAAPLSIEAFRAWVLSRPDEEHWELIAGVPTRKAPASKACRRITSNLEWRLNDALEAHRAELMAYQRVGLNLAPVAPDYDPSRTSWWSMRTRPDRTIDIRTVFISPPRSSPRATGKQSKASATSISGIRIAAACS